MDTSTRRVAFAFIAVDLLWLGLFLASFAAKYLGFIDRVPTLLHIEHHMSLGSFWIYFKFLSCAALLWASANRSGQPLFRSLAVIFFILAIEDALELHERIGPYIIEIFNVQPYFGIAVTNWDDPIAFGGLGLICLALAIHGYRRSSARARQIGWNFLKLIVLLACFGVLADFVSALLLGLEGSMRRFIHIVMSLVEDGGEMIVVSLITVYAIYVLRSLNPSTA